MPRPTRAPLLLALGCCLAARAVGFATPGFATLRTPASSALRLRQTARPRAPQPPPFLAPSPPFTTSGGARRQSATALRGLSGDMTPQAETLANTLSVVSGGLFVLVVLGSAYLTFLNWKSEQDQKRTEKLLEIRSRGPPPAIATRSAANRGARA